MKTSKFASIAFAAMLALALSLGLVACNNSDDAKSDTAASTSTKESTSDETTSSDTKETTSDDTSADDAQGTASDTDASDTTSNIPPFDHPGMWSGASSDGGTICYYEDTGNGIWEVVVVPGDRTNVSGAVLIVGDAAKTADGITVTDINTGESVDVAFLSTSDSELNVSIAGAKATLTPCDEYALIDAEDAVFEIQASAE